MATFPTYPLSQDGTYETSTSNLSVIKLGNGYEHVIPMGRNYKRKMWNCAANGRRAAEIIAWQIFLNAMQSGETTTWTPNKPGAVSMVWRLNGDYTITPAGGNLWSVNFSLRQVG